MESTIDINFNRALRVADELICRQKIKGLKINVLNMEYDKKNIIFDTMENYSKVTGAPTNILSAEGKLKDGYTIATPGLYLVLYNSEIRSKERINWTIAHEIGHIYLDHDTDGPKEEIEAHFFAAQLLMPEQVLRSLKKNKITIDQDYLVHVFGVSKQAAKRRIDTLNNKIAIARKDDQSILRLYSKYICNEIKETKTEMVGTIPIRKNGTLGQMSIDVDLIFRKEI